MNDDDFMDQSAVTLVEAFSAPLRQLREEGRDYEWILCIEACEWIQRNHPQYIVSTDVLYGDGTAKDAKADLRMTERDGPRRVWVEEKPMWEGDCHRSKFSTW